MRILTFIFGDVIYRLRSRLVAAFLRMKGVKVGRNFFLLGELKLKIRGKYSNVEISDHVQFLGDVDLRNREDGRIIIGDGVKIDHGVRIIAANRASVRIGRKSKVMFCAMINAGEDISIGEKSGIAAFSIISSSSHGTDHGKNYMEQDYIHSSISIGDGVQVGSHSVVLPGTEIGSEAMISAHSVVSGDIKENTIVGGIPARLLGHRKVQGGSPEYQAQPIKSSAEIKTQLIDIFKIVFPSTSSLNDQDFYSLTQDNLSEWDSLNQLKLFAVLEQELDIKILDEDAIELVSFSNILTFIASNTGVT